MNRLALLVVTAAALVWVAQWLSVRALGEVSGRPLPPRLHGRVLWWAAHRAMVGTACAAVALAGLTGGLLTG